MFNRTKIGLPAILLAFLIVLVQSALNDEEFEQFVTKCLADNKIDRAEFEEIINQNSSEIDRDNIDQKYKCYLHCLATEVNILDSDGYVDIDLVNEFEKVSDKVRDALEECKNMHDGDEDACDYAFNMLTCLIKNLDD
ncbi:general odorant-binding protein 57c-like [Drosophila hydei]|uniref:General odorant-binding protein 57c-like n=1 Tax=Drosophila hydei TaxID=7224 RepID=A0A6J1LFE0_DROHY|nr:general odorant-binding protein 57c-like [Drosophila hydei]